MWFAVIIKGARKTLLRSRFVAHPVVDLEKNE
jgi:hypothetical protein